MYTYETPNPISVHIDAPIANVYITAADQTQTTAEVMPSNLAKSSDAKAADSARVDFVGGYLSVIVPKNFIIYTPFRRNGSVDIKITVPAASSLKVEIGLGTCITQGQLGDCTVNCGMGDLQLDYAQSLRAESGFGKLTVRHVSGDATLTTSSGAIAVGEVLGNLNVKSSNGAISVETAQGKASLKNANGSIRVKKGVGPVVAKTSSGSIEVEGIERGSSVLETANGSIMIGLAHNTLAWLDAHTGLGSVKNFATRPEGSQEEGEKAEIRARSSLGNITVVRA